MSVQVEPYQLRFLASRISVGAQEMLLKANRLENIMNDLVQGSWKGDGAHAFAIKCEVMKSEIQKAVEVLNNAIQTLNRFVNQMDRVNQLRQQANLLEQQSWQYSGDSIDELYHRQNLARQAAQIRQEAEWEANAADAQAANEFQAIMEQMNQYGGSSTGSGDFDDLPEPMRSYYLRHRDLLGDESNTSVAQPSFAQMKHDDEMYVQDHEQLLEAFREYYLAQKPDYLSKAVREEAVEDDMKYLSELTNEQLYNRLQDLMSKDEQAQYYAKLVQQPNFDAKEAWNHDSGYREYVKTYLAQNEGPAGFSVSGMVFAAGIMKALTPRYSHNAEGSSYREGTEDTIEIGQENVDLEVNMSAKRTQESSSENEGSNESQSTYVSTYEERLAQTPVNHGEWTGERGESTFIHESDEVKEILGNVEKEGIDYSDAIPDFAPVSKGAVKIEGMSIDRDANFKKADELLAKEWGTTAKEVKKWRRQNKYTWHELNDMESMELVPSIINSKFGHLGGVSEVGKYQKTLLEGEALSGKD